MKRERVSSSPGFTKEIAMSRKFTQEQRLSIGSRIYHGEMTTFEAADRFGIHPSTARDYMRLYRDTNHLPPKSSHVHKTGNHQIVISIRKPYQSMSREELLDEICRLRINEERLKKSRQKKGGDGRKVLIPPDSSNTR